MSEVPVLQYLEDTGKDGNENVVVLSTGVKGVIKPVGASLIDDVVNFVEQPKVPTFFNEEKGRDEENPNHPDYLQALKVAEHQRATAAMEALLVFGLELTDGIPEDNSWLKKLQFLEKRGAIDLSRYPDDDPEAIELLYKKYVAVGTQDLILIGKQAGLNGRDVEEAAKAFKSK